MLSKQAKERIERKLKGSFYSDKKGKGKQELGKETIDTLAINKTKSRQGSTSYNDGILGRELMTVDELAQMDNSECIVLIRGLPPFKTLKYRLENHLRYNQLDEGDKENNTYLIESVKVEKELTLLDVTEIAKIPNYDSEHYDNVSAIKVNITSGKTDGEPAKPVSMETQTRFVNAMGIYCRPLASLEC